MNLDVEFKFFYLKSFSWMNYIESIEQLLTVKAFNWRICNILHQKTFPNAILLQTLFFYKRYSFLNAIPFQTLFLTKRYSFPNAIPFQTLFLSKHYSFTQFISSVRKCHLQWILVIQKATFNLSFEQSSMLSKCCLNSLAF